MKFSVAARLLPLLTLPLLNSHRLRQTGPRNPADDHKGHRHSGARCGPRRT